MCWYTIFSCEIVKQFLPVEHIVVLKILCSPTTLHIFDDMIFKELF